MKAAIAISILLLGLSSGLIFLAHLGFWGLCLDLEIRPVEVLNLALTLAIAIVLQYYFVYKSTDFRAEKDLLLGNIEDVISILRACREELYSWPGPKPVTGQAAHRVLQLFRRLSNSITHLEDAIRMSQCKQLAHRMGSIWNACDHYKFAATAAPFPLKPTPMAIQDRAFRELSGRLQELAFEINKLH
jgi:hypothetical protein